MPLTSAVLSHVPSRHSGMAASATNTARQLGAVFGVAALGAVINAHLISGVNDFVHQFPGAKSLKNIALKILETGGHADSFDINNLPESVKSTVFPAFLDGVRRLARGRPRAGRARRPGRRRRPRARPGGRPRASRQLTSTGWTEAGSAPPSTASSGSE